jgi:hypothetical protein
MPSFKPKTVKKIKVNKKNSTTLDGKHKEFVNEFNKDENDKIPRLKKEKMEIKSILEKNSIENTLTIEQVMDYHDKLEEITNQIKQMKSKKIDYFLDNSKYIFDYFENKKDISIGNTITTKNKMLESFFKMKPQDNSSVIESKNNNIFQKYLSNIDESFLDINAFVRPTDVCQSCFKGELIPMDDEGVLICNLCSKNFQYLIDLSSPELATLLSAGSTGCVAVPTASMQNQSQFSKILDSF